MSKTASILRYIVGFIAGIGVFFLIHFLLRSGDWAWSQDPAGEAIFMTLLLVAGLLLLPIFILKRFMALSRKVKNDDSHFDVNHIPDDQPDMQPTTTRS